MRLHKRGKKETGHGADTPRSQIKDAVGNEYGRPKDVAGEKRMAFTSLADTAFDVCFSNTLTGRRTPISSPLPSLPSTH